MSTRFFSMKHMAGLAAIFTSVLALTACTKNNDKDVQTPVSAIMTFNLTTDQEGVGVALSGNVLPGGYLPFTSFSGRYLTIIPGTRTVQSFSATNNMVLDSLQYAFETGKYYSLFVVGAKGDYSNIISVDNYDSLTASSGNAYVRYINAIPDSTASAITISANETNVVNTTAAFKQFSNFKSVTPGQVSITVNNGSTVNANRNITVQAKKAYTVLFTGIPNATDTSKRVQIKFIENGTITD